MRLEEVIGGNIRARREDMGITQEDLGRQVARYLGREWPRQSVFTAEKGGRSFTANELLAFALALGVSMRDLFRPPADEQVVTMSSGVSVDAGWLQLVGAPTDKESELQQLRQLLRDLESRQGNRLDEDRIALRYLESARIMLDNLAESGALSASEGQNPE